MLPKVRKQVDFDASDFSCGSAGCQSRAGKQNPICFARLLIIKRWPFPCQSACTRYWHSQTLEWWRQNPLLSAITLSRNTMLSHQFVETVSGIAHAPVDSDSATTPTANLIFFISPS